MPVPEASDVAPWWVQLAAGVGGIGTLCAMIAAAFRSKREDLSSRTTVSETVSLADEKPFRDGFDHIEAFARRIADNSDIMVAMMRKRIEDEERRQIRAEARIAAQEEVVLGRMNERLAELDRVERHRRSD